MTTPSRARDADARVSTEQFEKALHSLAEDHHASTTLGFKEWTLEAPREAQISLLRALRDNRSFQFDQLVDLCGVDYAEHAIADKDPRRRFAVVYHLLSVRQNRRLRVVVYVDEARPVIPSVASLWASANWYEREAFDLFGILFEGHPDLRRLLTDYGFVGHPFRKDFPLSGHVEMRFDEEKGRVVYEPVSIDPRVTVPRVVRREIRE